MLYHWIIAVLGIGLLLWGWAAAQRTASQEECKSLTDETTRTGSLGCHGCSRAGDCDQRAP